jgi:hypothetical protein
LQESLQAIFLLHLACHGGECLGISELPLPVFESPMFKADTQVSAKASA